MKNKAPLISVIIPVFNSEHTIEDCIESILNQNYDNIEIILVDDGSSDNSIQIIKNVQCGNKKIKIIKLEHGGPNAARKAGIEKASGDYVMFVDSDDSLIIGAIPLLVSKLNQYNVDVIRFNARYKSNKKIVVPIKNLDRERVIEHKEIERLLLTTYTFNSLWSQLYKTNLIKQSTALNNKIDFGEDLLINIDIHRKTKHVLLLPNALYEYNVSSQSISHSIDKGRIIQNALDRAYISNRIIAYSNKYIKDEQLKRETIFRQFYMLWNTIKKISLIEKYNKKEFLKDFAATLEKENNANCDIKELRPYLTHMTFKQSIIDKRAVVALINADYDNLWRCIKQYGFLSKTIHKGVNK
ncbi:glycosyltransferase [Candidatus Saccharibacteria bacterium]|nr:glycosyltransferase [Candidatus Saccharibacteria bacterium]